MTSIVINIANTPTPFDEPSSPPRRLLERTASEISAEALREREAKAARRAEAALRTRKERAKSFSDRTEQARQKRQVHDDSKKSRLSVLANRAEEAQRKRHKILSARAEKNAFAVKRAHAIAANTKAALAAAREQLASRIDAKLAGAEVRAPDARNSEQLGAQFSDTSSTPSQARRTSPRPMAISPRNSIDGTSAPPPFSLPDSAASSAARIAVPVSLDAPPPPHAVPDGSPAARLLAQIEALSVVGTDGGVDFGALQTWMQTAETVALAREWLVDAVGAADGGKAARPLLSLVYLHLDRESALCESDEDKIMKREAKRFYELLLQELRATAAADGDEDGESGRERRAKFGATLRRARRFLAAWSAQDKPKTLHALFEEVAAARGRAARAARDGGEAPPPEATFAQIARLGGAEAEAAARQLYGRNFKAVDGEAELRRRVAAAAQRAMLDVVKEQLAGGDTSGLFSLLGELQQAMLATVAHSVRQRDEINDRFDAKWLEQQAAAGALTLAEVHNLMLYVARTIEGWQAPADAPAAAAWVAEVTGLVEATAGDDLGPFIASHLPDFVGRAVDNVGAVYKRIVELQEELGRQRAAEEGAEGGASSSAAAASE